MKNIILATALLVAFSSSSFAKEKNDDPKLLKELSATLKNSTAVHWVDKDQYKQATFSFRNKTALAFYKQENNELIGFGVRYNITSVPEIITEAMKDKYSDWQITDAMIFVEQDSDVNYFAEVQKNGKTLILKITANGKLNIYARVPSRKGLE